MRAFYLLLGLLLGITVLAQQPTPMKKPSDDPLKIKFRGTEKRKVVNLSFNYDFQSPSMDMAKRFGNNSALGIGCFVKTKSNLIWGGELSFMFGPNVKENTILDSLTNSSGNVIGINGGYSRLGLSERGYFLMSKVGKVIPVLKQNKNSGFIVSGGVGFMQHKLKITAPDGDVPALSKAYKKGYDRLTNGLVLNGFVGIYYLDRKHFINFYAGYNYLYGFTQSRRDWNFDTMTQDKQKRNDVLSGFRFGWIIPIYPSSKTDEYIFY